MGIERSDLLRDSDELEKRKDHQDGKGVVLPINTFGPLVRRHAKSGEWDRSMTGALPENPKDMIGSAKLPLHLWPTTASAMGCLGLLDGALKYGRSNFRQIGVRASIYADACKRHVNAWFEGEDVDPDSGLPHLAHALACLAILVDAQAAGKLYDDRMVAGGYRDLVTALTPHVARLKEAHAGKNPKHYTIADGAK